MTSGIMKVEAIVISRARRPRLITLAETLIIPDITNTELSFYCCFMENIQKLLCEMQVDFICASKNKKTNAPSGRTTRNPISFLESSFSLSSRRKRETLGATILGVRNRCTLRSETEWAEFG